MSMSLINLNKFRNVSEQRSILEWDALDRKLQKVLKTLKNYPKGFHPATLDPVFLSDAAKLANGFLVTPNTDQGYIDFSRRLTICKENKDVNEVLLNYATTIAIFKRYTLIHQDYITVMITLSACFLCRTDMTNYVPNPTQTKKALAIFRRSNIKSFP